MVKLTYYAIQNSDGKFYNRLGSWMTSHWVKDLQDATLYSSITIPRQISSTYANQNPNEKPPKLLKMTILPENIEVIDETDRIEKQRAVKALEEVERDRWAKQRELENARRDFEKAKEKIEKLSI